MLTRKKETANMTETTTMPKEVFDALKVILDDLSIEDSLDFFAREGDSEQQEYGRQLQRAFRLLVAWHDDPTMTPDLIRGCLEDSDYWWREQIKQVAVA
jgi:hypothetical protein